MNPKELLDAGRLTAAVQELNQSLKNRPADKQLRMFLFELLCFAGDYDRAGKQLDVLATQTDEPGGQLVLQFYRGLLSAEKVRQQVFGGTALPKFVLTPPSSVEQYVMFLNSLAQSDPGAADLLAAAEDTTPALAGRRGETPFTHLRDADDRVAPVLEAFHGSDYLWLPFEQMTRLQIAAPTRLQDLLWANATVEMRGHPPTDVYVPALYVNSHTHENEQVRLGRMTEWDALSDRIVTGKGQRMLLVDDAEQALLGLGEVEFEATVEGGAES
jgi:type VI secretion system protein ImpE